MLRVVSELPQPRREVVTRPVLL